MGLDLTGEHVGWGKDCDGGGDFQVIFKEFISSLQSSSLRAKTFHYAQCWFVRVKTSILYLHTQIYIFIYKQISPTHIQYATQSNIHRNVSTQFGNYTN